MLSTLSAATARRFRPRTKRLRERMVYTDVPLLILLSALLLIFVALGITVPDWVPYTAVVIPLFAGSIWLGPRFLPWYVVACLLALVLVLPAQPPLQARQIVGVVVLFVIGLMILFTSFQRSRLGVAGLRGEAMLLDLRDRLLSQSTIPGLPREWHAESVLTAAGGTQFAGDFLVVNRATGRTFDAVLVDVSGKGVGAATRSLLLSGAFGALMSAIPPSRFLEAANAYLLRQNWGEGFATAIHLHLNLGTGDFELRKAGHPPAVWLHAGSGGWSVLESDGPALGLLDGVDFDCVRGTLRPGDGIVLYTDGLVEDPTRDISSGIDKLAGRVAKLVRTGFEGAGEPLVTSMGRHDDDRAMLLVHRRWETPGVHAAR